MRPIAAFSMSDYEQLTRQPHQVAEFRRGKDKKKRKRRGLGMAAAIGGGLAGAGALAAGARYGGAELRSRMGSKYLDQPMNKMSAQGYAKARKAAESGGAAGALSRDITRVKNAPGRAAKAIGSAAKAYTNPNTYKAMASNTARAFQGGKKVGGTLGGLRAALGTSGGKAAAIGAGLAGAAALGGAAYGAKKLMDRKKKKK